MIGCIQGSGKRHPNGYFMRTSGRRTLYAHREAWERENGPIPTGMHVMHLCDNPGCVNVGHLSLGTHSDNHRDKVQKGRQAKGARIAQSKLSDEAVICIMARLLAGEAQRSVAKAFGVSQSSISDIWIGETWSHLFASEVA